MSRLSAGNPQVCPKAFGTRTSRAVRPAPQQPVQPRHRPKSPRRWIVIVTVAIAVAAVAAFALHERLTADLTGKDAYGFVMLAVLAVLASGHWIGVPSGLIDPAGARPDPGADSGVSPDWLEASDADGCGQGTSPACQP